MTTLQDQPNPTETAPAPATKAAVNVGEVLKELRAIRDAREVIGGEDSKLAGRESELKSLLFHFHEDTGLTQVADHGLSVVFTPGKLRIGYVAEKWDELQKWLTDNGYGYCIQRRLNEAKLRELVDSGTALHEGLKVEPFTDIRITRK